MAGQLVCISLRDYRGDPTARAAFLSSFDRHAWGGVIVFGGDLAATADLLAEARERSPIPPLVTGDFERGLGQQFPRAGTRFPSFMAFGAAGDPSLARAAWREIGRELAAAGFHVDFMPVADLALEPANPIVADRAASDDRGARGGDRRGHGRGPAVRRRGGDGQTLPRARPDDGRQPRGASRGRGVARGAGGVRLDPVPGRHRGGRPTRDERARGVPRARAGRRSGSAGHVLARARDRAPQARVGIRGAPVQRRPHDGSGGGGEPRGRRPARARGRRRLAPLSARARARARGAGGGAGGGARLACHVRAGGGPPARAEALGDRRRRDRGDERASRAGSGAAPIASPRPPRRWRRPSPARRSSPIRPRRRPDPRGPTARSGSSSSTGGSASTRSCCGKSSRPRRRGSSSSWTRARAPTRSWPRSGR